jgi:hypothetical protein
MRLSALRASKTPRLTRKLGIPSIILVDSPLGRLRSLARIISTNTSVDEMRFSLDGNDAEHVSASQRQCCWHPILCSFGSFITSIPITDRGSLERLLPRRLRLAEAGIAEGNSGRARVRWQFSAFHCGISHTVPLEKVGDFALHGTAKGLTQTTLRERKERLRTVDFGNVKRISRHLLASPAGTQHF